jgi:hypothetical protein
MLRNFDAESAVLNMLDGYSYDGATWLRNPIPFTTDLAARQETMRMVELVVDYNQDILTPETTNQLVAKLLRFLSVSGWQTAERIRGFPWLSFAQAVRQLPEMLVTTAGVTVYLQRMEDVQRARRKRHAELRQKHAPPRPVIWQQDDFRLVELTHPLHLLHESAALGHCLSSNTNYRVLGRLKGHGVNPASEQYLTYWLRMEWKQIRLFSFEVAGKPRFTLEVNLRQRSVQQIQGKPDDSHVNMFAPFWPYLCRALIALQRETRFIRMLADFNLENDTVLLPDGTIAPAELDNLADAVTGYVTAKTLGHPKAFDLALSLPSIDLDLTGVPEDYLREVEAIHSTVVFGSCRLTMPKLRRVEGHCYLYRPIDVRLPLLEQIKGELYGGGLTDITLPQLRSIGGNFISHAHRLTLPALLSVGGAFCQPFLTEADLRSLRYIGRVVHFGHLHRTHQVPNFVRGHRWLERPLHF